MSWKRRLAVGVIAAGLVIGSQSARAEDPAPEAGEPAAAPVEAPKKKEPFFGDHFAMYLETRGGPASVDAVENPLTDGPQSNSMSELNFNGSKAGQLTIGWTLPRDRGQYLLTYNVVADGDFELDATGLQQSLASVPPNKILTGQVPWWYVTIRDGQVTATQTPPVWNNADDQNGNQQPDPNEVRYPTVAVNATGTVAKDLGNRFQTWDLYYRREYGGVKIRSRWTAGIRYLDYAGSIATPSWLTGTLGTPGFGYSDGIFNDLIVMQQSTTGWGPMGSGEIQFNFFRKRLSLYALAQVAFLLETLEADSGAFTYLTRDTSATPTAYFPGYGRIGNTVSKSGWNTTFEVGARVKLLEGFHLIVDWNRTGYLDTLLLPNDLSLPGNAGQTSLGTTARFTSRDFVYSAFNVGLSFQF